MAHLVLSVQDMFRVAGAPAVKLPQGGVFRIGIVSVGEGEPHRIVVVLAPVHQRIHLFRLHGVGGQLAAGGIQHLRPVGADEIIRLYPLQHRGVQGMARPAGGQRHQHSLFLRLLQRVSHGPRGGKAAFFYQGSIHIQSNQTNFSHRFLPKSLSL